MNFYAYLPDKDGSEPCGTDNRIVSKNEYKTLSSFMRYRLIPYYSNNFNLFKVFTFTNFYDDKTFKQVR